MKKLFTILFASVLGMGITQEANAQFNTHFYKKDKREKGNSNWYKRIDVGGHYLASNASFKQSLGNFAMGQIDPNFLYSHTNTMIKATGYGGRIGYYIPVTREFNKFSLNLSIAAQYTAVDNNIGKLTLYGQEVDVETKFTNTMLSFPVGFDLKWGGESTLRKSDWATVSLGAGVLPTYHSISGGAESVDGKLTVRPYAKAEVGFTTGIHWKIYALWSLGRDRFLDYSSGDLTTPLSAENPVTITQNAYYTQNITLGLSFSVGSLFWDKRNKW